MVFIPRAQPYAQSLFLFPIVFGINLIHFSMRRRTVQPEIQSFVSVLRSPVTLFDRSDEECELFRRVQRICMQQKCELIAIQEGSPRKRCKVLARKSAKLIANFSATKVTSLPSHCLSVFLSLTEPTSRTM